ncbi:MAG: ATP-binding cassette domain-containing protein [Deltaproteobacteria bacterium]|nr:ATP-binding cassette domain-containing protein [Deltaproteobacteria bacterium]
MIEVTDLSRRYGNVTAVDKVSFHIGRGEIVGLLGHNGAGKSTIMKMLTGFLEPNAGEIRIAGEELQTHRRQAQTRIGYLPENCPLYLEMSVVDFLDYSAALRGLDEKERPDAIRRAIFQTGLEPKAMDPIATLSRGYRQRTGVAQALLHSPEILILDEPTNGLDPGQIEHMRNLIRELGHNTTVIVSTHILQEVEATCDRVLILRQGKLALDARLDELTRGNFLQLRSDASAKEARGKLGALPGVAGVEFQNESDGISTFRLEARQDATRTAAEVAEAVVNAGWRLYSLHREERSLEKIFHEITAKEVTVDAA